LHDAFSRQETHLPGERFPSIQGGRNGGIERFDGAVSDRDFGIHDRIDRQAGVFGDLRQALGTQYVITYSPSNRAHDGTFRKIKVEVVDPEGHPLPIKDQKGKPIKYSILTKSGYKAPHEVE